MALPSWVTDSQGQGYRTLVNVSKNVRHASQPMYRFRQFVETEPGYGKQAGDTFDIYRVPYAPPSNDSEFGELERIPTTTVVPTRRSLTIKNRGKAIPFTGQLEDLAELDVESNVFMKFLKNHQAASLDIAAATAFKSSDVIAIPTGASAITWDVDGTASTQATSNITTFHIKEIVDAMKVGVFGSGNTARPVPFYANEHYICIASVKAMRGLKDDPDWVYAATYANERGLYTGEVGMMPYYGVRFVEQNFTSALSNGVGSSSVLGEAIIFGADAVREIVVVPEEVREKIPENYGLDKGIAWYSLLGFGRVWDFSTDSEEHIVRITSS
jgi:N4-gp56 family major capsid protein